MKKKIVPKTNNQSGFSIVELLVVVMIISILSAITIFYLSGHQKLYKPDDQALKIVDVLQEARQRSLTERETMRVEISLTKIRLIDENRSATETDDRVLRELFLLPASEVVIENRAGNITVNPPEPIEPASAQFVPSVYPSSANQDVCTLRFQSSGKVVNAGNSATGNNATVQSVTIHNWSPDQTTPENANIARAITIIGTTGTIRMWEYNRASPELNKWSDSRR